MDDESRSKEQLQQEVEQLRQRVEELEAQEKQRKQTEEALCESEERFRVISDQALMGIIILQEEYFVYVNDKAAMIMDVTVEEVANWSVGDYAKLIHPDDLAFVMEQGRKKQTGEKDAVTHYNWRMVTPRGNLKWIEMWSKTIPFRSRTADMVTIIDISERKQAEMALREANEFLPNIVNAIADPVFVKNDAFEFVFVNTELCTLLGKAREEIMGTTGMEYLPQDQMDHFREVDQLVLSSGEENACEELLTDGGGEIRTILTKKTRIVDAKGAKFIV